jgi:hypothetical protein
LRQKQHLDRRLVGDARSQAEPPGRSHLSLSRRDVGARGLRAHVVGCVSADRGHVEAHVREDGVILFSPSGTGRVDSTKIRDPPKRGTSTSAPTSSGVDSCSTRGMAKMARCSRSSGTFEPVGPVLKRDVVDADAGLLDRAVVVRPDQLAVFGDAHLQNGLGVI